MNIEKLVAAALKIAELDERSKARSKAWSDLARESREGKPRSYIEARKAMLDAGKVIVFDDAIQELVAALKAKP